MEEKEKLDFLIQYHKNLVEQMKANDFFVQGKWKSSVLLDRVRKVEGKIDTILMK